MSLIVCDDCEKQYSIKAEKCPECASPNHLLKPKSKSNLLQILSTFAVVVGCCLFFGSEFIIEFTDIEAIFFVFGGIALFIGGMIGFVISRLKQ